MYRDFILAIVFKMLYCSPGHLCKRWTLLIMLSVGETLYIVIPAYNEQENIRTVIEEWYPIIERFDGESRLVVVDDGSKDDTYRIMQECAKNRPLFIPLTKPNSGHGASVLYAYQYALNHGADYIFQTDSDGQTRPSEFGQFWENRQDYDMVIGWRRGREDGFARIVVTKTLKYVIRLCFGVSVTDANTPFRLLNRQTLATCMEQIPEGFNLSNVILSVLCVKKSLRVKYIPITFRPRQGGVNSINLRRIVRIGMRALVDFYRINKTINHV